MRKDPTPGRLSAQEIETRRAIGRRSALGLLGGALGGAVALATGCGSRQQGSGDAERSSDPAATGDPSPSSDPSGSADPEPSSDPSE